MDWDTYGADGGSLLPTTLVVAVLRVVVVVVCSSIPACFT